MTGRTEPMEQLVARILADAGLPMVGRARRLAGGVANHVYAIDDRYVVRIGTAADGECFPQAAAVMRAVEGEVLCPRVLHADFSKTRYDWNVMVCSWLPGRMLDDVWLGLSLAQKRDHVRQVARQLERIHRVPPAAVPQFARLPPRRERFLAKARAQLEHARSRGLFPHERLDRMGDCIDDLAPALALAGPDVVIHNDAHLYNTLSHDGRFSGLLDFDDTELAPAENDVRYLIYRVIEKDPSLGEPQLCDWIGDLFPTYAARPGRRERATLDAIGGILSDLAGEAYWETPAEQRADADAAYRKLFPGRR